MTKTIETYSPLVKYIAEIRSYGLKLKRKGLPSMPPSGKPRDVIKTLSVASGGRLWDNLTAVRQAHGRPLWVCLTYPDNFPGDWSIWKRHLHNLRRTLFRDFALIPSYSESQNGEPARPVRAIASVFVGGIWRLEAQRRGAPHYHMMLWTYRPFTAADLDQLRDWMNKTWYRIVGSGDSKHLMGHGVTIEQTNTEQDIFSCMGYLNKYLGKDSVHPDSQVFTNPVGRYWGVWGKKELLKKPDEIELTGKAYARVRRVLYKQKEVKAKRRKSSCFLKRKCSFNRCAKRQLDMPGTKTFMDEKLALRLLNVIDPPPF
jgi:hypothetical protein